MKKYVLKRCKEGNKSYNDFEYPKKGVVEAKDWKDSKECGHGLHGWTLGFEEYTDSGLNGNFIVLEVETDDGYVELGDKVKFKKGKVVLNTPEAKKAHDFMLKKYPEMKLHWAEQITDKDNQSQKAGYSSTQKAGDSSTQTAGYSSTQTAGYYSTQTAGYYSTQTAGYSSTQTAGDSSTQTAGYSSTQTAGYYSTQTAGYSSTQTAGYSSTQTAGGSSTQTAGGSSTQTAGYSSTQTAGYSSTQTAGYFLTQTAGDYSFINNFVYTGRYNIVRPSKCSVVSSINIYTDKAGSFISTRDDVTYVINGDCKIEKEYTTTPDNIKKLEEYEIFVFGSNKNGAHIGGAAKLAADKFEAKGGVGEGLTGQSYAFPTLDKDMQKVSDESLKESVKKLYECANKNTGKIFLLTKVGCGIAGGSEDTIKEYFKDSPANIIKPKGW